MAKNFEIRMNGMETVNVNTVDDAVDVMMMMWEKHPSNTIFVNDMWVGCGRDEYGKWHIEMRDAEMNFVKSYEMGKIKRGMDKAIADVLNWGFDMFNNNMEENNMVDMEEKMIKTLQAVFELVLTNEVTDEVMRNVYETLSELQDMADRGECSALLSIDIQIMRLGMIGLNPQEFKKFMFNKYKKFVKSYE